MKLWEIQFSFGRARGLGAHFDDDPLFNDREERLKIVRFLIENGADINGLSTDGETALHTAAKFDVQFVRLLLELGASHDIKDTNGKTPLDWAKELGQQESVEILSRN
jgi:ankyrin repeat protein